MSDDLVAKLKRLAEAKDWGTGYGVELTLREAADEIERLRAEHPSSPSLEEALRIAAPHFFMFIKGRRAQALRDPPVERWGLTATEERNLETVRRALKDVRPDAAGEKQGDRSAQ